MSSPYPGALQADPVAAQDPSYLAFMRGAGYSEADVLAELARKKGQLDRQLARSAPRFADQLRQATTGVQQQYSNNGLYRSGARMGAQVDARNAVQQNQLDFNSGISDQEADLHANAIRQIAQNRQQAAEQALNARQNIAVGNSQVGMS